MTEFSAQVALGDGASGCHRYLLNNEMYSSNANRRLRR